jgi:hypothetical protein
VQDQELKREFPRRVLPLENVTIGALTEDTLMASPDDENVAMAWWLPREFWELCLMDEGNLPPELVPLLGEIDKFVVIAAADGSFSPFGLPKHDSEPEVRRNLRLIDSYGWTHKPLSSQETPGDLTLIFDMMRLVLARILGAVGEGFHFFVFPGKGQAGSRIAQASRPGQFKIKTNADVCEFRTPLSAILEPKLCPLDGAPMSGDWNYCPWHGQVLMLAPR